MATPGTDGASGASPAPRGIAVAERLYFGVIALAALFVSWLGWAAPARLDESFTWASLPTLHAEFVGALYAFGGVYMACCVGARYRRQVAPAIPAVIIFTGLLLAVTLLNIDAFDFDLGPPWVWTLSYVFYPILGIALIVWARNRVDDESTGPELPAAGRVLLLAQGAAFALGGLGLLVAREPAADHWPWVIDEGLAQFYAGPFLAIGYCCWRYSTRRRWVDVMTIAPAMLVFSAAALLASIAHRDLFSGKDVVTWLWFAWFAASTLAFALLSLAVLTRGRTGATPVAT